MIEFATLEKPELFLNGERVSDEFMGKLELDNDNRTQRLEYYGLDLIPGENLIELKAAGQYDSVSVWRALNPSQLALKVLSDEADGVTPVRFALVALDENGISNGFGALSIETNLEPLEEDAFPDRSGYQLLMKDGEAILTLRPVSFAQRVTIKAQFNDLEYDFEHYLGGTDATL